MRYSRAIVQMPTAGLTFCGFVLPFFLITLPLIDFESFNLHMPIFKRRPIICVDRAFPPNLFSLFMLHPRSQFLLSYDDEEGLTALISEDSVCCFFGLSSIHYSNPRSFPSPDCVSSANQASLITLTNVSNLYVNSLRYHVPDSPVTTILSKAQIRPKSPCLKMHEILRTLD